MAVLYVLIEMEPLDGMDAPIVVTKCCSGCCATKAMNSSTYDLMVSLFAKECYNSEKSSTFANDIVHCEWLISK